MNRLVWLYILCHLFPAAIAAQDQLAWSPDAVAWTHYREQADGSGNQVAFTYVGIEYHIHEVNGRPAATYLAIFRPADCWVKAGYASKELLIHEQRLFDIAELYARKMRKDISVHIMGLPQETSVSQLLPEIRRIYRLRMNEMLTKIQEYNVQTLNGTSLKMQQKWNAWVDAELGKLDMFRLVTGGL
jgi:hypothetical protein